MYQISCCGVTCCILLDAKADITLPASFQLKKGMLLEIAVHIEASFSLLQWLYSLPLLYKISR